MTYHSAIPVPETQIGIALEATRGTPEAPTYWIPVMGPKYKPDLKLLPDEGLRGSMVTLYDEIPGLRFDSHGWDQYPYLDSLPILLRALLGSKDTRTNPVSTDELVAEAKVGDKKVLVLTDLPAATVFVIDEGTPATEETVVSLKSTKIKAGEYEIECAALKYTHVVKAPVTVPATELIKEAKATDTTIEVESAASIKEGVSYVIVGAANRYSDTRLVTKVTGKILTLAYPLSATHATKAPVTVLTSHAFSLLNNAPEEGNQPPSCTLTDFGGETNWRQLAAAQLDSITLNGTAETLPKLAANWFADAAITPSPPSASFSAVEAPPGWTIQASVGGVQIGYLVSWEFSLKRNVKNVPAITGTQAYYQHFAGAIDATAKVTVLEDPEAIWLTAYENGELESIDLTLSDVESGYAVNLHSSKAKFVTGDLDRSKEWVEVPLEVQLIPSAADALAGGVSPIVATVANGTPTEY